MIKTVSHLLEWPKFAFPKEIFDNFCIDYKRLDSLEGCPSIIHGCFSCCDNNLTSLEGCPVQSDNSFYCARNKITSLEFAPKYVGKYFGCSDNKITSLVGIDRIEQIEYCFQCVANPITEGGLGLLLIPGIRKIESGLPALDIIDKYSTVDKLELMYDCQAELIEKGFEAFTYL